MIQISFIVPFYNVEKYIGSCLNSIFQQDLPATDYEVICIDDCSPDNSRKIVEEFQKTHSNLKLIVHEKNKCLGGARNTGLKAAKGKYVWFVDSDDCIAEGSLKKITELCNSENPEVILFNFSKISLIDEKIEDVMVFPDKKKSDGINYVKEVFGDEFVYHLGYVWRMIIKTEFLSEHAIYFPENAFWEDTVFMPKVILLTEKICSISDSYYLYRVNPESVTGIFDKQFRADLIYQFSFLAGKELLDFAIQFEKKDLQLAEILRIRASWYFNSFLKLLLKASPSEKSAFFLKIRENSNFIQTLSVYFKGFKRFILIHPSSGYKIICILTPVYFKYINLKNKLKNK
jgi:glycosyltransferase involved in cell wall biosynthesis